MNIWPHILMFAAGIIIGVVIHPLARMLDLQGSDRLFGALARLVGAPFSRLGRLLRRRYDFRKARQGDGEAASRQVDPREQQLSDSAQTIRNILLSLATVIQRTDQAASDSSQTLGDVRETIDRMAFPGDLLEVHSLLLQEVDRMISSNTNLKRELARSQGILATQRRQIETLRTAVRIDSLTQLANRAYFDERLAEMIKLRQRYDEPFSLLMIDVDNFKEINDTHGHQGGDRILKGVAFKIRSGLRESDFVARFGGDEFAVILIRTAARAAADVAWKLCYDMRESRFLLDGTEIRTTLSIGLAEACPGEAAESILGRADAALYRVKEMGRNSVVVAEEPAVETPGQDGMQPGNCTPP